MRSKLIKTVPVAHEVFLSIFSVFVAYDSLVEKACKQISSMWMCGVLVSYWLEFLIHIHSSPRVSHISNCSLLSEDVSSAAVRGPILPLKKGDR